MMKRRKTETMIIQQYRARKEISLSSKKEDESDIRDNTDPNQADDKY